MHVTVEMVHKQFCCFVDHCVLIETRGNTHTVLLLRLLTAKATRKSCDSGTIFRGYKLIELLYLIAHEIASQSYLE